MHRRELIHGSLTYQGRSSGNGFSKRRLLFVIPPLLSYWRFWLFDLEINNGPPYADQGKQTSYADNQKGALVRVNPLIGSHDESVWSGTRERLKVGGKKREWEQMGSWSGHIYMREGKIVEMLTLE